MEVKYHHFESQHEQIINCPNMYISSIERIKRKELLFDYKNLEIKEAQIDIPYGLERLFIEVISNASDNVIRTRKAQEKKVKTPSIDNIIITMEGDTITVENSGIPIPVKIHDETGIYIPELIFGHLRSSSNYFQEERIGSGVNGLGVKLVNIFSVAFSIEILDPVNKLKYTQSWEDHMRVKHDYKITKYKGSKSLVKVTYKVDLKYFGYDELFYPEDAFYLFAFHAVQISYTTGIAVIFNDVTMDFSEIEKFAKLFFKNNKNYIIYKNNGLEFCACCTIDKQFCLSYVNSIITRNGGAHVNAVYKAISSAVYKKLNFGRNMNINDIKPHISLIVSYNVSNPSYVGQTKDTLNAPKPRVVISESLLNKIMNWPLKDRLLKTHSIKVGKSLAKATDGKKKKFVMTSAEDANKAGSSESSKCTLFIVEGKSAASYATNFISSSKGGRDYLGCFAMKGKPLNIMNASEDKFLQNKEFIELKKVLGLKENFDYLDDDNYKTLRYGQVLIMADSDTDGKHIIGLLLNFFYCRYTSLLQRGFVMYLRTPILRVFNSKECKKFYTLLEYEKWKENNNVEKWKHKYYKGLATSNNSEIKEDAENPNQVMCVYDDKAEKMFKLAFDKELSDKRKKWIAEYKPCLEIFSLKEQPISDFLTYELVEYSIDNLSRSIPKLLDGLKESQRKIIWGTFLIWSKNSKWNKGVVDYKVEEKRVERLASDISGRISYHHGDKCLGEAIENMAFDFVGSNNLPYFTREGQLGTRNKGGKDCGAQRYISVKPEWWLPLVFKNEDVPLLEKVVDEGVEQEPITMLPILPTILLNGAIGIASGYSTFVPCYNPLDVCRWIKAKLREKRLPKLKPWYRGFNGRILFKIRGTKSEPIEELGEEHFGEENTLSMVSEGCYEIEDDGKVHVTELPLGLWTYNYSQWLLKLVNDKEIKGFVNHSKSNTVDFYIEKPMFKINSEELKLIKSFSLSNMVLLDIQNKPHKYNDVDEILETFFSERYPYYIKRKEYMLESLQEAIDYENEKYKFISYVIEGKIKVMNEKKSVILKKMEEHDLRKELLDEVKTSAYIKENLKVLQDKIQKLQNAYNELDNKSVEDIWCEDIDNFVKEYKKHY